MRYGIFSDVHSNLEAFEAVIKAFQKEKIDKYLCLGDIVGYGANPNECVEVLKSLPAVTVAGNHDWAVVDLFPLGVFNEEAKQAILWTSRQLSPGNRNFLSSLELVHEDKEFVLVHGGLDEPQKFKYLLGINACQPDFELLKTDICFIGHTHVPVIFVRDKAGKIYYRDVPKIKIEPGNKYIINAGSVGQPRDSIPDAVYCIWDTEKAELEIKRAAYDVLTARRKIIEQGLPEFLGNRLLVGN